MANVTKVRNEIRFTREDGKYWYIDINDGTMHGFSGKIVKRTPNGGRAAMEDYRYAHTDDIISIIIGLFMDEYPIEIIKFVEKAMNAHDKAIYSTRSWNTYYEKRSYDNSEYTDAQLIRGIAEMLDDDTAPGHQWNGRFIWTVESVIDYLNNKNLFSSENSPYKVLADKYGINAVRSAYDRYRGYDVAKDNTAWLERVFKYKEDKEIERLKQVNLLDTRRVDNMINDIFNWCSLMEVKLPKGNLIDEYLLLKNNYETWRNKAKQEAFAKVQSKVTEFSADGFTALVPTTIEELVKEGNEQRNCLGGMWLDGYGNTEKAFSRGVVFVRRDANIDKPYITCDFSASTGMIYQYYGTANTPVCDDAALDFKVKLQKHLNACCNPISLDGFTF